jgi:hypothetical protein
MTQCYPTQNVVHNLLERIFLKNDAIQYSSLSNGLFSKEVQLIALSGWKIQYLIVWQFFLLSAEDGVKMCMTYVFLNLGFNVAKLKVGLPLCPTRARMSYITNLRNFLKK